MKQPYSWNFSLLFHTSATIIQPIFMKFSHCYSTLCHNYTTHIPELFALLFHMSATTLSHDVMGQLTTDATPIPHLHTNKYKQYTHSIPTVFQPLFQPQPATHQWESGCNHQEFLEFYIVLYSPHSPHRVPGKVPHIIVLDSTIDSTMDSTMGSTIKYYG